MDNRHPDGQVKVERRGSLPAGRVFGLTDFLGTDDRLSRDGQIGSIGGGNHFLKTLCSLQ